eukprot:TCALIF_09383-PA protein Name:"Protein of unknown function" AED:0.03 eAED:0.03 QI:32/1/0.66/1/1/1/3/0/136
MADEESPPMAETNSRPGTSGVRSRAASSKSQRSRPGSAQPVSSRPPSSKSIQSQPRSRPASSVSKKSGNLSRIGSATSNRSAWSTDDGEEMFKVNEEEEDLIRDEEPAQKGCWHSFTNCVGGMWATREMETIDDRE